MHYKQIKLTNIWRICNKIRATIFRINLNLWDYFQSYDPNKNYLLSENKFIKIFREQLKDKIGLSEQEIVDLCDYFRIQDGRVFYKQLIDVVQENLPNFTNNQQFINGFEWEDSLKVNDLNTNEERYVSLLLTKIATIINRKNLILQPYFQDYELITKNCGTVTITHFARILHYLKITLSSEDFNLLVKKFVKNSYTINYIAFVNTINRINQYFDSNHITDNSGEVFGIYTELSKLPKLSQPTHKTPDLIVVLNKLQRFVYENRTRMEDFFKQFDRFNSGRIKIMDFKRVLKLLITNSRPHFQLNDAEIELITKQYSDPSDPTRVYWQTFDDDLNQVFTVKELEKSPNYRVDGGYRKTTKNFGDCKEICNKIAQFIKCRRILLKPFFQDYDQNHTGYITTTQMQRCLLSNNFQLTNDELLELEQCFSNENGFNYYRFLKEVDPGIGEDNCKTLCHEQNLNEKRVNRSEYDIVQILAKIKRKVVKERINLVEYLKDYDQHNQQTINQDNFIRGISLYNFQLTPNEIDTLIQTFSSPLRPNCIDYRRFCNVIDEVFTQTNLERYPLIVPIQHLAIDDQYDRNFLNFNERLTLTNAIEKLVKNSKYDLNLIEIFQDYDRTNCGTISQSLFERALATRRILNYLTRNEFDIICKCFSYERGMRDEVNYRDFLKCFNILNHNSKYTAC